jgi:hypothetical protein
MIKEDLRSGCHALFIDVPCPVCGWEIILGGDIIGKMTIKTTDSPRRVAIRIGKSRGSS